MSEPQRIQLRRTKGWRLPPGALKVARPGMWGNPFIVGVHGTQEECVAKFRRLMTIDPMNDMTEMVELCEEFTPGERRVANLNVGQVKVPYTTSDGAQKADYYACFRHQIISSCKGRDLACWCALDQPCHADVLLEIANRPIANYRVAAPTNSIEQPHQSKIPTQPQGEGS